MPVLHCCAQGQPVYSFWKDDTILRKKYYQQSLRKKDQFITAAGKEYAKDYKEIYEVQFTEIGEIWQSTRAVTAPEINEYLQSIVQLITAVNPELKGIDARVVFSRDGWPNAVSMGDGTILVNAGLMLYLKNEAELVFVICHELSHYYLDHSNKRIKKLVAEVNSEAFKAEVKRLSKQEYRVGQQTEDLLKKMAFGSRRHSRENEAEADRQAFQFMKNTGFDCNAIGTCLQMLNHVDDTSYYKAFIPEQSFNFTDYAFKKKWTEKVSAIFGQMNSNESALTKAERDSLQTHPDCEKRISLLKDSLSKQTAGRDFIVNEALFKRIKKDFFPEIAEQEFSNGNLPRNLYYSLQMLQNGDNSTLAVYSIARDLNLLYERQRDHKLGVMDKEGRMFSDDYNLLLRMIDRWHLDEIASVNYYFCMKYKTEMSEYPAFREEMAKAIKYRNNL
jgi:hypothetical protein